MVFIKYVRFIQLKKKISYNCMQIVESLAKLIEINI